MMEATFPGVLVYIAHKESASHIFKNCERTITKEQLESSRDQFAYVRELACDMSEHPVESFMRESEIPYPLQIIRPNQGHTVLITKGSLPTKSLSQEQIESAKKMAPGAVIDGPIQDAGWVIGVESEQLFEAGAAGIRTTLIKTGIGENIYKRMFPAGEVMKF